MDLNISWFTAWMPSPQNYLDRIIYGINGDGGVIEAIDTVTYRIQQPVVMTFLLIATLAWFIFMFND